MKYLSFFLILALMASCTITKRVHNPGWHVEWKSNHSRLEDSAPLAEAPLTSFDHSPRTSHSEQVNEESRVTNDSPPVFVNTPVSDNQDPQVESTLKVTQEKQAAKSASLTYLEQDIANNEQADEYQKKMHPMAIAALVALILSLVTFGITLIFSVIFAFIALQKINASPKKWKGKKLAITVLALGGIGLVGILILLMLISGSSGINIM